MSALPRIVRYASAWACCAMLLSLTGCLLGPDGRPLGAGAVDALTFQVGCNSLNNCPCSKSVTCSKYGGCCKCGERCQKQAEYNESMETYIDEVAFDDESYSDESIPTFEGNAPCGACEECSSGGMMIGPGMSLGLLHRLHAGLAVCRPRHVVSEVANFCIPPSVIGPPEVPPPGSFFPVPVRPVFSPRGEYAYGGDTGWPPNEPMYFEPQ